MAVGIRGEKGRVLLTRITLGFWLIVIGGLLILDRTTSIDAWDLITQWWPLILIFYGLASLTRCRTSNSQGWILLVAGLILQAQQLGVVTRSHWHFIWPIAIIVFGLWLILNRPRANTVVDRTNRSDVLDITTIFGSSNEVMNSQSFRGGQVFVLFGDVDVDLRNVNFAVERAAIEVNVIFGDLEIIVPRNCRLEFKPLAILGEAKEDILEHREESAEPHATIYIHGVVLFGALKVRN